MARIRDSLSLPSGGGTVTADAVVATTPALIGRSVPPVSVGLPVYNGERYLGRALAGLLAQEGVDFELVIADNCSTDATEQICREAASQDRRVRYIRRDHNVGLVPNHNLLVHETRGEFLAYGAADDEYRPDRLRTLLTALRAAPDAVLAFSAVTEIDPDGRILRRWHNQCRTDHLDPAVRLYDLFARTHPYLQFYGLMRRSSLLRTRLQPHLKSSDRMLLAECALLGAFVFVPEELLRWRRHPEKSSEVLDARSYYPDGRTGLPNVDEGRWLAAVIARAPLSAADRIRCYAALRPWICANTVPMMKNLAHAGLEKIKAGPSRGRRG